jgi:hypothetical protein
MEVRVKRSHAGPAVRGGPISFAAGARTWSKSAQNGTTGRFGGAGPAAPCQLVQMDKGQLVESSEGGQLVRSSAYTSTSLTREGQLIQIGEGQLVHLSRGLHR